MTSAAAIAPPSCIKQDCPAGSGLAALATVAQHYGLPISASAVRP